jgi:hypothetical protein
MAKKPPLNEVVKAFSLNKTQDTWIKQGKVETDLGQESPGLGGNKQFPLMSARAEENMSASEHNRNTTKLVYFSARIPLEVRNAIRSASVHRKNAGLSPASEQDITKAALIEWLDRNKQG